MNRVLLLITAFTCFCTAVGFLGRQWWFFELFSHFRVQYFVVLAGCGIIYLVSGKYRQAILPIALALVNFSVIGNYQGENSVQASIAAGNERTVRALLVNVNSGNQAYTKLHRLVSSTSPDIVVLLEVNEAWMQALQPLMKRYPYAEGCGNKYGVALLSRLPFQDAVVKVIGNAGLPSVIARFAIDGQRLTLIGTHPFSPITWRRARDRNKQFRELAKFVSGQDDSIILLGDLNVTPWSPFFIQFLRSTGLRDSREGFGLQPTWPAGFAPMWIPIDHILVSPNVIVNNREVGPNIGSDHYPVLLDFSLGRKPSHQTSVINSQN